MHFVLHGGRRGKSCNGPPSKHDPCQRFVLFTFSSVFVGTAGEIGKDFKVAPDFCHAALHPWEIFGRSHTKSNLHHVVFGRHTVDVHPRLALIQFNNWHDVKLDDAWGNVRYRADTGYAVNGKEAIEEREALSVRSVHKRAVPCQRAVHTVSFRSEFPTSRFKGCAVQDETALGSEDHFIESQYIDCTVGLARNFVGDIIG